MRLLIFGIWYNYLYHCLFRWYMCEKIFVKINTNEPEIRHFQQGTVCPSSRPVKFFRYNVMSSLSDVTPFNQKNSFPYIVVWFMFVSINQSIRCNREVEFLIWYREGKNENWLMKTMTLISDKFYKLMIFDMSECMKKELA